MNQTASSSLPVRKERTDNINSDRKETHRTLRRESSWTFLTNHAHVVICLTQNPELRMRDVADRVGITERAVQRIIADLEEAGVLVRVRDGRRNHYEIHGEIHLRHPVEAHRTVADLMQLADESETESGKTD